MVALTRYADDVAGKLSEDRLTAQLSVLRALEDFLSPASPLTASGEQLTAFLAWRVAEGRHVNTVRKERTMVRTFYTWAWKNRLVDPNVLLSIRSVAPPAGSSPLARPQPYTRHELATLWATLEERWPRLPEDDEDRWLRRWSNGVSPYSRVRAHAIHLQLRAIIVLALQCGLRRGEIYRLRVADAHPDNAYIVVTRNDGTTREAPFTVAARSGLGQWLEMRAMINPDHKDVWLSLWSEQTMRQPMRQDVFEGLLLTYLGPGWTLRRLRDTCGVHLVRAGMGISHVAEVLGHRALKDALPYLQAAGGDAQAAFHRVDDGLSLVASLT